MPFAISSDGRRLFTLTQTGGICVWDTASCESLVLLETQVPDGQVLALSPDETRLGVGGGDGVIKLWDLQTRTLVTQLPRVFYRPLSLVVSPDNQFVAISCYGGQVEAWQISGPRELWSTQYHTLPVSALAISALVRLGRKSSR